ncbi:hypothetical protein [Salinibacterium sp. SWN1162]|uniref:hypothetical protein n=1 Tax=Salinibacterium sp. SWN1162 TaxID=2792053 RepID=UPI0018CFB692|nr:hypothetical protein [Salinibacterium sp. SWN1162]MBH0008130.1 hypothetical protein [Salinibacterium sp. SWN1162]
MNIRVFSSGRTFAAASLGAAVIGGAAYLALSALAAVDWLDASVLNALASYALPVAIFVGSNFLGMLYYLVGRAHFSARRLLLYRVVQTVGALILPVGGYVLDDLSGAIWGYALVSVANAAFAAWLVRAEGQVSQVVETE